MKTDTAVREVLRHAANFQNSVILIAPSGIGPLARDDLEMLLLDAELLVRLGIKVWLVEYKDTLLWKGLECPHCLQFLSMPTEKYLVSVATEYQTSKLCLIAGADRIAVPHGVLDDVTCAAVEELLKAEHACSQQSRHALEIATAACRAGIPRVHFFNAHRSGALLEELFTDSGGGTMVYTGSEHKEVRAMKSTDRFTVQGLVRTTLGKGTTPFVRGYLPELRVFTIDGDVHGSMRLTKKNDTLVVRMLTHSSRINPAEVLERLLRAAIDEARTVGAKRVAVPIDEIPAFMRIQPWFSRLGFSKAMNFAEHGATKGWQLDTAA
jgi:hypothetical protein